MKEDNIKFSLTLDTFTLEFVVDLDSSVELTESFRPDGVDDFTYAAGEIWVHTAEQRQLVIEERGGANLLSTLAHIRHELRVLKPIQDIEKTIPGGGWCAWMQAYWTKLQADQVTAEDDHFYGLLSRATLVDGKSGSIAAYLFQENTLLEVCAQKSGLTFSSRIEKDVVVSSVREIERYVKEAVISYQLSSS